VPLHVAFEDTPGMLAAISQAANGENANIRSCHLSTNEGQLGSADLVVDVDGRGHLEKLLVVLRRLPGVITVEPNVAEQARHLRVL
jgi:(p)ppGpp synthase/HD superfamily hydrolase